jgi:hypothetical protein
MRSIGVVGTFARDMLGDATVVVDALASLRVRSSGDDARLVIEVGEAATRAVS